MPIDAGLFIGGAVTIAVDPADPNHLFYATDTRLLQSRNGGRDWKPESSPEFRGPTLAIAFDSAGTRVLAATAGGVLRSESGNAWTAVDLPASVHPALFIVPGKAAGRFYVVGTRGVFRSDDRGTSWMKVGEALPDVPSGFAVIENPAEVIAAVVLGNLYTSADAGATWTPHRAGLPDGKLHTLAADPVDGRVWAAGENRIYRSDDAGQSWNSVGQPLPQADIVVNGIAAVADAKSIAVTMQRGLYRSVDAGMTWVFMEGNLPVHLEAGPLIRDPHDAMTIYAPFSLTPYNEIRRHAVEGNNLLSQVDPVSLVGGGAFLVLLAAGAVYAARKLWRMSASAQRPTTPGVR